MPTRARSRGPIRGSRASRRAPGAGVRGIAVITLAAALALLVASAGSRGFLTGDAEAAAQWHSFAPAIDGRAAAAAEARAAEARAAAAGRDLRTGKPRNASGVRGATFQNSKRPRRDRRAPTTPSSLGVTSSTPSAIALSWVASKDRIGVAGYRLYVNGQRVGSTRRTSHLLTGLACGTSYTLAVEAYDAARNRSAPVGVVGATAACPDVDAPAAPSGLAQTATSESSASFSWAPTSDNVGVAGYGVYQGSVRVARTAETAFTLTGLACGGTYTVAVDAHDAAGNRSAQTALILRTSACPDREAPSTPRELRRSGETPTSIQVEWAGSRDNVGVTSYGAYVNGVRTGTTENTSFTFSGLDCGTSYTLGIDAVDAAGNRSPQTAVVLNTGACSVPPPPAPGPEPSPETPSPEKPSPEKDEEAPTAPSDLAVGETGRNAVAIAWSRSSDNVGVEGYRIYRDGIRVGGTSEASFTVSGLDCGKSYTLSVEAFDAAGNGSERASANASTSECASESPDDTEAPETPSGLQVGNPTQTTLSASWTAANDNVGVAGYGVYVDGQRVGGTSDTSFTLSGLECGRSYTVAVDAVDAAGNRSSGADTQGSTAECDAPTPSPSPPPAPAPSDRERPTPPGGLALAQATETSVSLTWTASSDNVGVLGYVVYQNGDKAAATEKTTYTLVGLTCGTSYTVAVGAYDAAGNQSDRTSAVVATSACPPSPPPAADTTPPSTPNGLVVRSASQTSVQLSWQASTDDVGVTGYGVYRDGTRVGGSSDLNHTFSGLECGTTYLFGVDARDAAGNRSSAATVSAATSACAGDTQRPSAPSDPAVTGTTQTTIGMSWSAAADNVAVTGYHLYLNGTRMATVTGTTYTYTGLTCGTTYDVAVEATDAAGNVSDRASVAPPVTTAACDEPPATDTEAPTTPAGLAVSSSTQTSITIAWEPSTDNIGVTEYGAYVGSARAATTTTTTHTFSGLECGTSYTVAVDAADAAGNRSQRSSVVTTTSPCPDTQPPSAPTNVVLANRTGSSLSISWTASTDNVGVVAYGTYRNGTLVGTPAQTSYTYWGLNCGTTYTLSVDAVDAAGNRSPTTTVLLSTSPCSDTQPPTVPTSFRVTGTTATSISVAWNASTDNIGVAGYGRYSGGVLVASDATRTHTFSGLACGTSYTLAVDAYDAAGNRSSKATLNASTSACAPPPGGGDLAISPSGSDSNPCTAAAPCRSVNRAYGLADPGAVVELAGGSYPGQSVNGSHSGAPVVFRPAAGANVSFSGKVDIYADNLEIQDVAVHDLKLNAESSGFTIRNSRISYFAISGADNWALIGNDVAGPGGTRYDPVIGEANERGFSQDPPTGGLLEGNYFHDWRDVDAGGANHIECLQFGAGVNITIRNNRFANCDTHDIFIRSWGGLNGGRHPLQGFVIENNFFPKTAKGSYAVQFQCDLNPSGASNNVIRYNSFGQSLRDGGPGANCGLSVVGNVAERAGPCTAASYSHNVFFASFAAPSRCSPTDRSLAVRDPGWVNMAGGDLHLLSTSPAINAGDPSNYPASDIDGRGRPLGSAPDAGAHEAG